MLSLENGASPKSATAACAKRPLATGALPLLKCRSPTSGGKAKAPTFFALRRPFKGSSAVIAAATLDEPSVVVFSRQIGIESRLPWFSQLHLLPEVKTQDSRPAIELARLKSNQHKDED